MRPAAVPAAGDCTAARRFGKDKSIRLTSAVAEKRSANGCKGL
jgi:hypothetical protein